MCNGTEYYLSDCPGYDLNNVTGDYCLGGEYQAGVRCVDGIETLKLTLNYLYVSSYQCLLQRRLAMMDKFP